jgi:hypothetical protein
MGRRYHAERLARRRTLVDPDSVTRARLAILLATLSAGLLLGPALGRATIEEQRDRLPPPATECSDPIAGQWRAHVFYAHVRQWYVFVLDIERVGESELRGSIKAEFWDGDDDDQQPPECRIGSGRAAVFEPASGEAKGLDIRFDATSWRDEQVCGSLGLDYLLDRFSGTIDPERMEFQSLLNADAPQWRDIPTVFRRVRCGPHGEDESVPRIVIAPPPFQPPDPEHGCGFRSAG